VVRNDIGNNRAFRSLATRPLFRTEDIIRMKPGSVVVHLETSMMEKVPFSTHEPYSYVLSKDGPCYIMTKKLRAFEVS
jgi:hypothetical protein